MTAQWGLVRPNDHVVVIQMLHDSLTIKIVSVDEFGRGIASVQPQSLKDMIEVRPQHPRSTCALRSHAQTPRTLCQTQHLEMKSLSLTLRGEPNPRQCVSLI